MANESWKTLAVRVGKFWILSQIEPVANDVVIKASNAAADTSRDITVGVVLAALVFSFVTLIGGAIMGSGIVLLVATFILMSVDNILSDGGEIGMLLLSLALVFLPLIIGLGMILIVPRMAGQIVSGKVRGIGPNLLAAVFKS